MRPPTECVRCKGAMEPGFCVDRSMYGHLDVQHWVAGQPKAGWFGRLKTIDLVGYEVHTFRCTRCGCLESYVPRVRAKPRSRRASR